jgi:hypothetical protein
MNRTDGVIVRYSTVVRKYELEADIALTEFIRLNCPFFSRFIPN